MNGDLFVIEDLRKGWKYMRRIIQAVSLIVLLVCSTSTTSAVETEAPPFLSPQSVLGGAVAGPDYRVLAPVESDGALNIYTLETKHGRFRVEGHGLLFVRLLELAALRQLEKVSPGKAFAKGLGESLKQPLQLTASAVTQPGKTVVRTVSGVGELLGRIASGVVNRGETMEGPVQAITGVSAARRNIARQLGVDPYTDFKPLADRMSKLARATASGGLLVRGGIAAIPGAAGLSLAGTSLAGKVSNMVYDKSAAQLRDVTRSMLANLGIKKNAIRRFLGNKRFTPTDQVILADALKQLEGVQGRELIVARAGMIRSRGLALFLTHRVQLLAKYHQQRERLAAFFPLIGFPVNLTRAGRVVVIMPFDTFAWTEKTSKVLLSATDRLRRSKQMSGAELRITGWATPKARQALRSLGWTLSEAARP